MIKARERLESMDANQYPHIQDQRTKRNNHRDIYKKAYPEKFEKKVLTTELEIF